MKKKLGVVSMVLGSIMILSAIGLIAYNRNEEEQAALAAAETMPLVQSYIQDENKQELQQLAADELTANDPDEADSSDDDINDDQSKKPQLVVDNQQIDTSTVYIARINGSDYIGYLSIPRLGLELPVLADWSYSGLKKAPCRYSGLHYGDDMVIAAHNYKRHFGNISKLQAGDTVIFTDMQGLQLVYTVALVELLAPEEVDRMVNSEWDLTLYTCTYGGVSRVTVRCNRAS